MKDFLHKEYRNESLEYPFVAPLYHGTAALWGAKTVYFAAQLLLLREQKGNDVAAMFPAYDGDINASSLLSADLCLRFLPVIVQQATNIDAQDTLVGIIEGYLKTWHYSAIGYALPVQELNFDAVIADPCVKQLYLDRVMERQAKKLAEVPFINEGVKANAGNYIKEFWKNF